MSTNASIAPALFGLLGFVVLFALGSLLLKWLQKRLGQPMGGGGKDVRVLRRSPLGWQCELLVVEVAGRQYILTTSRNGGVTYVDEVDTPLESSAGVGNFGASLKNAIDKRRGRS